MIPNYDQEIEKRYHPENFELPRKNTDVCVYDGKTPAKEYCTICGCGLCSFCGYTIKGFSYCNEHYKDLVQGVAGGKI